ncbi:MAG: hypothetical protein ACXWZ1_10040 [Gaiellaceae bacterium]
MNRDAFHPPQPLIAGRPYFIVSVIPLAVGLVGLAPPLTAWLVGAAIAGLGALRSVWAMRERAALRRLADEQLVLGALPNSTPLLAWRASELVSRRNRRVLARSLHAIVGESEGRLAPGASPLNRRGVRPHLDLVRALAERAGKLEEPVSPRGMVLVEQLLCDGYGPLYAQQKANSLRVALERSLNALEPRSEHEPAPRTRFAVVRNVRPVEAPARSRVVRDRGRR